MTTLTETETPSPKTGLSEEAEAKLKRMFGELEDAIIDLPYAPVHIPVYIPQKSKIAGRWELTTQNVPIMRGYFNGLQQVKHQNFVLIKKGRVWMSLTPMEQESHMPHIDAAHGHVVVGGLGMGLYLYNIILKPEVKRVTVIEKDPGVIRLFDKITLSRAWRSMVDKEVEIIKGDIKRETRVKNADYVYVDIWPTLGSDKARQDMVQIMRHYPGAQCSWWGMELDFIEWAGAEFIKKRGEKRVLLNADVNADATKQWAAMAAKYGLDVTGITSEDEWGRLALRAAHNVTLY